MNGESESAKRRMCLDELTSIPSSQANENDGEDEGSNVKGCGENDRDYKQARNKLSNRRSEFVDDMGCLEVTREGRSKS